MRNSALVVGDADDSIDHQILQIAQITETRHLRFTPSHHLSEARPYLDHIAQLSRYRIALSISSLVLQITTSKV